MITTYNNSNHYLSLDASPVENLQQARSMLV